MASPFPGMDPYLENPAFWPDFHWRFINYWREAIADALPNNYSARIGERHYSVEWPPTRGPVTIPLPVTEDVRETFIEILHRPDRALVAVLEVLSPANKEEPGRADYLAKRNGLLRQQLHLAELDLLLKGQRPPLLRPLPQGDYYYLLARADLRPNCQVFAWTMRQPLPSLPVPLRAPDPDVHIDLGAVFTTAYQRGRYADEIDYAAPPEVHPEAEQQEWLTAHLQAARPAPPATP
jgi:hypothetical protein